MLVQTKGRHVAGTCKWILQDPAFLRWRDKNSPERVLWIRGGPGLGKTMLSVFLSQQLEAEADANQDFTLLYFFCNHQDRSSATHVLRSLLCQLLDNQPSMCSILSPWMSSEESNVMSAISRDTLWVMLKKMLKEYRQSSILCLIDGLDETDSASSSWLVEKFVECAETASIPLQKLRMLAVSRDLPGLRMLPQIKLDQGSNSQIIQDVQRFIDVRMQELELRLDGIGADVKRFIRNQLLERAAGTFLWVGFALHELCLQNTYKEVLKVLQSLPRGLSAYYDRMLSQIDRGHRPIAATILRWVLLSVRRLTLLELAAAIDFQADGILSEEMVARD